MSTKQIRERTTSAAMSGAKVDRTAGVIRGVLVCGTKSANNRSYPWSSGKLRHSVYEGRPVNCDHGDSPTIDRRLGWLANVRRADDGRPRADLHILKSHPMAERVFEAAERNPSLFGLSHVALCKTNWSGGVEVIESIESVDSVDLVADPATTQGIYESTVSHPPKGDVMMIPIHLFCKESKHRKVPQLRRLIEDAGVLGAEMPDGGGIVDGLKAAATAVIEKAFSGDTEIGAALSMIRKLIALAKDGDAGSDDDDLADDTELEGSGEGEVPGETAESIRRIARGDLNRFVEWLNEPAPAPWGSTSGSPSATSSTTRVKEATSDIRREAERAMAGTREDFAKWLKE